jgi:inner membrane protein
MDSLTQAALGACVTAACVPREHRRKALLAGAILGTLPDLDVLIDYGDAVRNFTFHRGFSHSLFVLPGVALVLWLALRAWWAPVRESPRRWLAAILLALLTHPLLDAHTAYGTQLLWPLEPPPVSWATLFIIDPLYTLPLLAGCVAIGARGSRPAAHTVLAAGLALSTAYLGWSWVAKTVVQHHARQALASQGLQDAPMFSVPTPFNTLLWRVVVLTDEGHLEGLDSLLVNEAPMDFTAYPSDRAALDAAADLWAVQRLQWFADGFIQAEVTSGQLVISDLRMGQGAKFVFRHAVAIRRDAGWEEIRPQQLRVLFTGEEIAAVWQRLLRP